MTDESWKSKREAILREHEEIRAMVRGLETELELLLDHPARTGDSWKLPELVKALRARFESHFRLEENGGLLGAGAEHYDAEMLGEIADLVAEHRTFERTLDRILGELGFNFVPSPSVQACFDGDLRGLISRFSVHEAAERSLLDRLLSRAEGQHSNRSDSRPS